MLLKVGTTREDSYAFENIPTQTNTNKNTAVYTHLERLRSHVYLSIRKHFRTKFRREEGDSKISSAAAGNILFLPTFFANINNM